jgi:hypothetical protein
VSAVALGITYGATKYGYLKVSALRLIDQKFAGFPCRQLLRAVGDAHSMTIVIRSSAFVIAGHSIMPCGSKDTIESSLSCVFK